jgi:excisionase family DNA binding protein
MTTKDKYLTVADVAEKLNLHIVTVRREIKRGNIKAFVVGRRTRISPKEFEAYVERNSTRVGA